MVDRRRQPALTTTLTPYHQGVPSPGPAAPTDPIALQVAQAVHADATPLATILFGSRARGDHREDTSDADIMVITQETLNSKEESATEQSAQDLADTLYGRRVKCHIVWMTTEIFQEATPYFNSIPTKALIDGFILSDQPHDFTSQYTSDNPPVRQYEWSTYEYHLRTSKEQLNQSQGEMRR